MFMLAPRCAIASGGFYEKIKTGGVSQHRRPFVF